MPVIKSAKKKLRQDKARTLFNKALKNRFKDAMKKARKKPSAEALQTAFSVIDKSAKNHIIHKNKAARMKSSLSRLLTKAKSDLAKAAPAVKPVKKVTARKAVL